MFEILQQLLTKFVLVIPNIVGATILIIAGLIICKIIAKFIETALKQIKIDKLADRLNEIDVVNKSGVQIKLSKVLASVVYYLAMLLFIVAATDVLQMMALSQLMSDVINYVPNLIVAIFILIIGILVAESLRKTVLTIFISIGIPSAKVLSSALFYFLLITVLLSALEQAKVQTSFLANNLTIMIGGIILAFSFGYGFASKDIMSNFITSFLQKQKFKKGDIIRIGQSQGKVIDMDSQSVTLQTEDRKIIIPLHKLTSHEIEILD